MSNERLVILILILTRFAGGYDGQMPRWEMGTLPSCSLRQGWSSRGHAMAHALLLLYCDIRDRLQRCTRYAPSTIASLISARSEEYGDHIAGLMGLPHD